MRIWIKNKTKKMENHQTLHNRSNYSIFFILTGRSNGFKLTLNLFYTSQAFQQDQDHSIRNPDKGDTHSRSWNKNKEVTTRVATTNQFFPIAF